MRVYDLLIPLLFGMAIALPPSTQASSEECRSSKAMAALRKEIPAPSFGEKGHPLPFAAHWNSGYRDNGFSPAFQLDLISRNHYLLPSLFVPFTTNVPDRNAYYVAPVETLRDCSLPFTVLGTQWEHILVDDDLGSTRAIDSSRQLTPGGQTDVLSPFGDADAWTAAGFTWGGGQVINTITALYPAPPRVIMLSNNEQPKLPWHRATDDIRLSIKTQGPQRDNTIRQLFCDSWRVRYQNMFSGFRKAFVSPEWRRNTVFTGYSAFGPLHLGRWDGWEKYSLHTENLFSCWPYVWEGASASYYLTPTEKGLDSTVSGPLVAVQNLVFMLTKLYTEKPDFWFEISVWDGDVDKKKEYLASKQNLSTDRYEGLVQYAMWLLKPRAVREFRGRIPSRKEAMRTFERVMSSVDRVHTNSLLTRYWRFGRPVANPLVEHPYNKRIPPNLASESRWYLLQTDVDKLDALSIHDNLRAFVIANVLEGTDDDKTRWLVYAYIPGSDVDKLRVDIPQYRSVLLEKPGAWRFYEIVEGEAVGRPVCCS